MSMDHVAQPTRSGATRRQFLRGAGGFSLGLPFLPSLLDAGAARAAASIPKRRFVQMCTQHGAIWGTSLYPDAATLTDSMTYAGRAVKRGKLAPRTSSGTAQLSAVLRGPSTMLTPALAAKMNVLRGLDVPWFLGHHTGGHLGNFARNDGNGSDAQYMLAFPTPTIDQLMAWSPKFYGDLTTIRQRGLVIGPRISYNWSNPANPKAKGAVEEVVGSTDAQALFKQIFVGAAAPDPNAVTGAVVDRVNADYLRLRNGNTRLSVDDRRRLDDHMQRLSELERKVNVRATCPPLPAVTTNTGLLIDTPSYPITPAMQAQVYQAMNDVIVAAFLCDTSRIAVMNIRENFSTYVGDWHEDVAHRAAEPDGVQQAIIMAAHQLTFEKVFLDLCGKLDVEGDAGTGRTYLDSALVVWTQESGEYTHAGQGIPVVTAGSAGGFLSTGNYCDYRDPTLVIDGGESGNTAVKIFSGLFWQQWLGTALQAMGLSRADYEQNGLGGYPNPVKFVSLNYAKAYPDPEVLWAAAGDVLPYLRA